jgi:hypothetical protein
MVMTAYLDESGTHGEQSPIVTIAGFIATSAQWSSYQTDLSQLLTRIDFESRPDALPARRRVGCSAARL